MTSREYDDMIDRADFQRDVAKYKKAFDETVPIAISADERERIIEAMIHAEIDNLGDMRKTV